MEGEPGLRGSTLLAAPHLQLPGGRMRPRAPLTAVQALNVETSGNHSPGGKSPHTKRAAAKCSVGKCVVAALLVSLASAALTLLALHIGSEIEQEPERWEAHFRQQAHAAPRGETTKLLEPKNDEEARQTHQTEQHFRTRVAAGTVPSGEASPREEGRGSGAGQEIQQQRMDQVRQKEPLQGVAEVLVDADTGLSTGVDFRYELNQPNKKVEAAIDRPSVELTSKGEEHLSEEEQDVHQKEAHFRNRLIPQVEL